MIPSRPYLIRAFYDWITDNEWTPYLLVNADAPNTHVPRAYVEDGKIVLNVSFKAVDELDISNSRVNFSARFNGVIEKVSVPVSAVEAIYARENGQGMHFSDYDMPPSDDSTEGDDQPPQKGPPHLRVVK